MKYSRKNDCVLYYDVVKWHKEVFGNNIPVNVWQLMHITGTESTSFVSPQASAVAPDVDLPKKYISSVKLYEFGVYNKGSIANKGKYPWEKLINSINKEGLKKPILAERFINGEKITYRAFEGKHRLRAFSLLEPFDKNRLVPCLIVDYNEEYSKKMFLQSHPNPLSSNGFHKSERR